uniref:Uncharacterized protein n=1 Tax=Knipowitschia caucasica TaxID=637954 RepID=A0AAV2LNT5_KNICA
MSCTNHFSIGGPSDPTDTRALVQLCPGGDDGGGTSSSKGPRVRGDRGQPLLSEPITGPGVMSDRGVGP